MSKPVSLQYDSITYTITLTNLGSIPAGGVEVTDQLPAGVTFASYQATWGTYDNSTGVWTVGDLAEFAQVNLFLTATVDWGTVDMQIVNCATLTAVDQANTNSANDSACTAILVICGC